MRTRCAHGGDIYHNDIDLDYSICVNPLGMPETAKRAFLDSVNRLESYPDTNCTALREKVAMLERHERIGLDGMRHTWGGRSEADIRPEELIFGNGAAELIYALCHAIRPKHVYLTEPGFGEYERAAQSVGAELHFLELMESNDFYMPGDGGRNFSGFSGGHADTGSADHTSADHTEESFGEQANGGKVPQSRHSLKDNDDEGSNHYGGDTADAWDREERRRRGHIYSMSMAAFLSEDPSAREHCVEGSSVIALPEWLGTEPGSLVFLSNPLHPTGTLIERRLLKAILSHCERHGIYLCLDECFLDLCPDFEGRTLKPYLDAYPHLIILRAFTKVYAMPGLRLGYLISASPDLRQRVQEMLQPWNISVPAQEAGTAAVSDPFYMERTRRFIVTEKKYLCEQMVENGLAEKIYRSAANYIFFKTEPGLYERLLAQHVLIRTFRDDRGLDDRYCRISIRSHRENAELIRRWTKAVDS